MTDSQVVIATPEWEEGIYKLLVEMHQETALASLDEAKSRWWIRKGLNRDKAIVGAIGTPDRVEASIGLFVGNFWYAPSDDVHLEDHWNYCGQEYRKSRHAHAMLDWARQVQTAMGMPVILGVLSTKRTQAKVELFKRAIGKDSMVGGIFVMGLAA